MLMDNDLEFADATALGTSGTGLALVGDVVDLEVVRDIGTGKQGFVVVQITTAPTTGTTSTVSFVVATDAQAAIATDGSATEHARSQALDTGVLVAGYQIVMPVPPEFPAYERFLGILQDVGTAALTGGAINAFYTTDPAVAREYPDAQN